VEEYLALRSALPDAPTTTSGDPQQGEGARRAGLDSADPTPLGAGEIRAARKELTRLERQISKLTARETKLHAEMALKATDHTAVQKLDAELRAIITEREELEETWLEVAETVG
jgi:hypothetical protein